MSDSLRAVLFDMDGVLIDTSDISNRLLKDTAARLGADLTADELHHLRGTSGLQFWSYVIDQHGLAGTPEEYWEAYQVEREIDAYDESIIARGVRELIGALHGEGVLVGLVTSASCWRTEWVVDFLGVRPHLAGHVCANDVQRHKPDPAPYLAAAAKLGVRPAHCLVVEDSHRGVRSARDAGAVVAAFVGFGEDAEAVLLSHGVIRDFGAESPDSLATLHGSTRG